MTGSTLFGALVSNVSKILESVCLSVDDTTGLMTPWA